MTRQEIKDLTLGGFAAFRNKISRDDVTCAYEEAMKQYDPAEHEIITNKITRPDKQIKVNDGEDDNGNKIYSTKTVYVSRLSIPMQKLIVRRAVAFLTGNPVKLSANVEDGSLEARLLEVIVRTWKDNKLDFKNKELSRLKMSETECAELWYHEPVDPDYWNGTPNQGKRFRLRLRILANSKGDKLFPIYDPYGDMIAFGREYALKEGDKSITHFDLYEDDKISYYRQDGADWTLEKSEVNIIGKIPVIYYHQDQTEWADVETLIDRLETLMSDYADMIRYFGSPMLKARGNAFSLPDVGEPGKTIQVEGPKDETDVDYLTWDAKPEAVIFEYEKILEQIYTQTQTPDISFSSMAGVDNGSGIKLKLMFMDAVLKAMEHWEAFGECIQRRINLISAAMKKINVGLEKANLNVEAEWKPFIPMNEMEEVEKIVQLVQAGAMSKKTAVSKNPLVDDPAQEEINLKEEEPEELRIVA